MPLVQRKSSLLPLKRMAEASSGKDVSKPKEAKKAVAKAATAADPQGLMKGWVAEVGTSSLRPIIYKISLSRTWCPG